MKKILSALVALAFVATAFPSLAVDAAPAQPPASEKTEKAPAKKAAKKKHSHKHEKKSDSMGGMKMDNAPAK